MPLYHSETESDVAWGRSRVAHEGGETMEGVDLLLLCPRVAHWLSLQLILTPQTQAPNLSSHSVLLDPSVHSLDYYILAHIDIDVVGAAAAI